MEHITFKGTARFPSTRSISEAIEGVGGSFNAATDRESTVYWVRVPRREATRAMDVLGELIVRPTLDDDEIDGERAVIVEEIRSYLDDPAEYAQILFQQAMFGDGPLGPRDLRRRGRDPGTARGDDPDFWRTTYRPANTVIAVAGDLDHDEAVALAGRRVRDAATASSRASRRRRRCPPASGSSFGARRDAIAGPARRRRARRSAATIPTAWILSVLNAVLGDGMSSRLFLSVREELGLAYDVSSGLVDYADAGALEVSAGVDPERLPAALDAILAELARLRDEHVPADELGEDEGVPLRRARAADGRDAPPRVVDRRPGGAPRPGPDARRGARGGRGRRRRPTSGGSPASSSPTRACGSRSSRPRKHLRGLERRLRLPA